MDGFCGAVAVFVEVVAFEDVENFEKSDAAGGRRRRADDVVVAIGPADRLALFNFVAREIACGDEAAALLHGG